MANTKDARLTIRLSAETLERIKALAEVRGRSVADFVCRVLHGLEPPPLQHPPNWNPKGKAL